MLKEDWIVRNWNFLSARKTLEFSGANILRFIRNPQAPLTGKFYGTAEFYQENARYGCFGRLGTRRLFLRPYIIAPMPESHIKAVYIDPKRYCMDEEGVIKCLDTFYELPIFIFTDRL